MLKPAFIIYHLYGTTKQFITLGGRTYHVTLFWYNGFKDLNSSRGQEVAGCSTTSTLNPPVLRNDWPFAAFDNRYRGKGYRSMTAWWQDSYFLWTPPLTWINTMLFTLLYVVTNNVQHIALFSLLRTTPNLLLSLSKTIIIHI